MKVRVALGTVVLAGGVIALGQMSEAQTNNQTSPLIGQQRVFEAEALGGQSDVYCFKISGLSNWSSGSFRAYSVGTTSCNEGTANLIWNGSNNQHPVIGQAMYRYKVINGHGRFEQIGQSWLKHGFCALDQTECGPCNNGTGCPSLAPGCSDPYTSGRNGSQGSAGPKYQVNATTGFFPYPPADPSYSGSVARRLRVLSSDVQAASNPGARYFMEAQYVHPHESPDENVNIAGDNASYREVDLSSNGTASGYIGGTVVKVPALEAWGAIDPQVVVSLQKISNKGSFRLAYRAYDNGDGTWDYEYAIHNLDIDASIGEFTIPVSDSINVTDIGFNDVDYHSGEPFVGTDWVGVHAGNEVRWACETQAQNSNANAIRWGTTYNFRFTADAAPDTVTSVVGFWKSGTPDQNVNITGPVGGIDPTAACCFSDGSCSDLSQTGCVTAGGTWVDGFDCAGFSCPQPTGACCLADGSCTVETEGDCTASGGSYQGNDVACGSCPEPPCIGDTDGNNEVNFNDLVTLLSSWGPCPGCPADFDGNDLVDFQDLLALLAAWGPCP